MRKIDDRDEHIIVERMELYDRHNGPRLGDWVIFNNGNGYSARISHLWPEGVQTSKGGSFYLGYGYVSFSGGLDPLVPFETLRQISGYRNGSCWIFHHDHHEAHNGVDVTVGFRVYHCSLEAP